MSSSPSSSELLESSPYPYFGRPAVWRAARALLGPLGVRFLNITWLSHMRPDAHSKVRYGGGRLPPDYSHLAIPGVPDWWNLLLLWLIAKCEK